MGFFLRSSHVKCAVDSPLFPSFLFSVLRSPLCALRLKSSHVVSSQAMSFQDVPFCRATRFYFSVARVDRAVA
jgi:hypothetical protein